MLIDLSTIDHAQVVRKQKLARIRMALNKMTVKQLRQFARDRHISLGGESSKQGLVTEIMSQYGSQWKLKEGEELE
jgi:hypothetical protein